MWGSEFVCVAHVALRCACILSKATGLALQGDTEVGSFLIRSSL